MLFKDGDEAITVRGLDQMSHFMHDDVLQQILRESLHNLGAIARCETVAV